MNLFETFDSYCKREVIKDYINAETPTFHQTSIKLRKKLDFSEDRI